jgi:hypothetical protein
MMTFLRMVLYRCRMAIVLMCGIAALTITVAIVTNKLSDSQAWMAVAFSAAVGGAPWIAGRAARPLAHRWPSADRAGRCRHGTDRRLGAPASDRRLGDDARDGAGATRFIAERRHSGTRTITIAPSLWISEAN